MLRLVVLCALFPAAAGSPVFSTLAPIPTARRGAVGGFLPRPGSTESELWVVGGSNSNYQVPIAKDDVVDVYQKGVLLFAFCRVRGIGVCERTVTLGPL